MRETEMVSSWGDVIGYFSPLRSFKICMTVQRKIITLRVFSVCGCNNPWEDRDIESKDAETVVVFLHSTWSGKI